MSAVDKVALNLLPLRITGKGVGLGKHILMRAKYRQISTHRITTRHDTMGMR